MRLPSFFRSAEAFVAVFTIILLLVASSVCVVSANNYPEAAKTEDEEAVSVGCAIPWRGCLRPPASKLRITFSVPAVVGMSSLMLRETVASHFHRHVLDRIRSLRESSTDEHPHWIHSILGIHEWEQERRVLDLSETMVTQCGLRSRTEAVFNDLEAFMSSMRSGTDEERDESEHLQPQQVQRIQDEFKAHQLIWEALRNSLRLINDELKRGHSDRVLVHPDQVLRVLKSDVSLEVKEAAVYAGDCMEALFARMELAQELMEMHRLMQRTLEVVPPLQKVSVGAILLIFILASMLVVGVLAHAIFGRFNTVAFVHPERIQHGRERIRRAFKTVYGMLVKWIAPDMHTQRHTPFESSPPSITTDNPRTRQPLQYVTTPQSRRAHQRPNLPPSFPAMS